MMARDVGQAPLSESPLYIRWGPDRSPYAIELKLDLVDRIRHALFDAQSRGQEIGGILVGALPTPQMPTLRIEDIEFVVRRAEDGSTFMLEGGGGERFGEARKRARGKERSTVGLFRSHLRSGPLRPSLADRTLLAAEFKDPVYLLLLTTGSEPFYSAFFVASNGPLPAEASVREFKLDPGEFRALPEVEPEAANYIPDRTGADVRSRIGAFATVLMVAIAIVGALYYFNQSIFLAILNVPQGLAISVQPQDGLLRISWSHGAKELDRSRGAILTIRDNRDRSERVIHLGQDELRLGALIFESRSDKGDIKLTLVYSASAFATYRAHWTQ